MQTMSTNANEIAEFLIEEEGLDRAIEIAFDGVTRANEQREYFVLSVWREVKINLLKRHRAGVLAAATAESEGVSVAPE